MEERIYIMGVGDDGYEGLSRQAQTLLNEAGLILGPPGLIDRLKMVSQPKEVAPANLDRLVERLEEARGNEKVILLTHGDPLFFGTARYLCDRLGKERFEVVPHVSSMQLAFARVKENWDDAYLTNLATQPLQRVTEKIRIAEKIGLFTTAEITPAVIAQALLKNGIDYFHVYVCENLGAKDERVTRGTLEEISSEQFASLNIMLLIRKANAPDRPVSMQGKRLFGNPDELFLHSQPRRGLITPMEVRAMALAQLDLGPSSTVWDVGAGTGSVSIEAAQLASSGHVYAIEMDAADYNMLLENTRRFGVSNVYPVLGEAPRAWDDLPEPDAVFIGGTGRAVSDLADAAWQRLRPGGRLVASVSSMEYVVALQKQLIERGVEPQTLMIQLSRSTYQLEQLRLEAANPTFLVIAKKELS
jgi:precorrin-6B C5,15-methyltransferase / cobalt-precorrin-6B C5,C15-methyltransferase